MLSIIPTIPVAGTTSVLGIDLLSAFRALIDMIGNAVATASPSALRRSDGTMFLTGFQAESSVAPI
jgi:Na+/H+-dicarboxylate symporter